MVGMQNKGINLINSYIHPKKKLSHCVALPDLEIAIKIKWALCSWLSSCFSVYSPVNTGITSVPHPAQISKIVLFDEMLCE